MPYKPDRVERILLKKLEMTPVTRNDPHQWYQLIIPESPTILTKLANNHKDEIGDELLSRMARELKIKLSKFKGIIDCNISKEQYVDMVRKQN